MDVLNNTFAQNLKVDVLSLDHAAIILNNALSLIETKFESYILAGLKTVHHLFKKFSHSIMSAKTTPVNTAVDLAREERLRKGDVCLKQFMAILQNNNFKRATQRPNQVSVYGNCEMECCRLEKLRKDYKLTWIISLKLVIKVCLSLYLLFKCSPNSKV